jgi:hypothetical protein
MWGFYKLQIIIRAALCLLLAFGALAGSVPVFRYAFERWAPDSFGLTLCHRGPPGSNEQTVVTALRQASDSGAANFAVSATELPGPRQLPSPVDRGGLSRRQGYPGLCREGPFNPDTGRRFLDSLTRRELVRRLKTGDPAVWMLLEGDQASDDMLHAAFRKLEREIEVPDVDPDDTRTKGNVKPIIAFSVLPLSRGNPEEEVSISMMLNTDPETVKAVGPIAFAFFEPGRMLTSLTRQTLTEENIGAVSYYRCGACSCEIKGEKSGLDMLLAADCKGAVTEARLRDPPFRPLVSLSTLVAEAQNLQRAEQPDASGA